VKCSTSYLLIITTVTTSKFLLLSNALISSCHTIYLSNLEAENFKPVDAPQGQKFKIELNLSLNPKIEI